MESDGTLWATRGFSLYRRSPGARAFHFEAHLPCPNNSSALLRSDLVRSYLRKQDVVQPLWLASGALIVSSGGWLWRRAGDETHFRRVIRLRFWGRGVGRGILYHGMVQLSSGRILFGEYFRNNDRVPVRVYASDDDGLSWDVVHEFPAGRIRHIHALMQDPFSGDLWLCTGDLDNESILARSTDGGTTFDIVGTGSQVWRTCSVLFDRDHICWGADTSSDVKHRNIYRLRRGETTPEALQAVDGAIEFGVRLGDDLLAFSTIRSGYEDPDDPCPRLWIGNGSHPWRNLTLGRWANPLPRAPGKAYLCTATKGEDIALSVVNLEPHDGMVVVTSRSAILDALAALQPSDVSPCVPVHCGS